MAHRIPKVDASSGGRLLRAAALVLGLGVQGVAVAGAAPTDVVTHQDYVEAVTRTHDLDIADTRAVFGFVFADLPARVNVYPTENYYYFKFLDRGAQYTGNIRLEASTRDAGKLQFSYSTEFTPWLPNGPMYHALLDRQAGVAVERIDALTYRVSFAGKSVVFALNDLSKVKPPEGLLMPEERYIGPIFDDSAVRFFLVYDSAAKQFDYILDETGPASDELTPTDVSDRILIGRRTGFAYYRDHRRDRKILIGVHRLNAYVNNAFDGPFDQLPDNFVEGESLRSAILEVSPELAGKIDRLGNSADGESRYFIGTYLEYDDPADLAAYDRCATAHRDDPAAYARCFVDVGHPASRPTR